MFSAALVTVAERAEAICRERERERERWKGNSERAGIVDGERQINSKSGQG